MSDFIATSLNKKIDHLMDIFFGAGVASHPTIIEQINYLLFMRALSQRDDDLRSIGVRDSDQLVFDGELAQYRWDNLLTLNAEQLFDALEACFRKIPDSTSNKTVRLVFRNAHIKLFDKPSLRTVVHEIDVFAREMDKVEHEGKKDIFGDTYEYLLSKLSQAGTSGQFRTPRHIIEFIVNVIAPKKGETILDPAVGTAGFLVKAFEYLRREYTSPEQMVTGGAFDLLNSQEHSFLFEHTFTGFDSDEDMIKFGMMNLYLHGLQNARMVRQNTLTDTAGNRDKYDVVLANPPFAGKIDRDSVAEELQMGTGATEVLFLRYIMRHLTDTGRIGVIVPEGILVNTSGAHVKIRQMLVENGLWCVVSLPSGVFNPYAGVKTSILFLEKSRKTKAEILFAKVEHDGFSLGAQRRPVAHNDLPEVLEEIEKFKSNIDVRQLKTHKVTYDEIEESGDYSLNGDRYKLSGVGIGQNYTMVELGEVADIRKGSPITKAQIGDEGLVPVIAGGQSPAYYHDKSNRNPNIVTISASGAYAGFVNYWTVPIFASDCSTVQSRDEGIILNRFIYLVLKHSQSEIYKLQRGGGQPHVYPKDIQRIKIPLLDIESQQRVVDRVENMEKAIEHARALITLLGQERSSVDLSIRAQKEGWPVVKLSEIADVRDGTHDSPRYVEEGYPLVTSKNLKGGTIDFTGALPISRQDLDSINRRSKVDDGDIIMPMIGTIGGAIRVRKDREFAIKNVALIKPLESQKVDMDYLLYIINSKPINDKFKIMASGATQKFVSLSFIRNLSITVPPLSTQRELVNEFTEQSKWIEGAMNTITFMEKSMKRVVAEVWDN